MVKKITQESRTKYQKAVEKGRLLKLQLSTIDQEGSELLLSLHFCGISILRIIDIVSNNNIKQMQIQMQILILIRILI